MKRKLYLDLDGVLFKALPQEELNRYECPTIFHHLDVVEGAVRFVEKVNSLDFEVSFLTKAYVRREDIRFESQRQGKIYALVKNFNVDVEDILVLATDEDKGRMFANTNSILVDDYGRNCEAWMRHKGMAIQAFEEKTTKPWLTAANLEEVFELLSALEDMK